MVFLNILWCAIVNRQTRINKCRAMAPNLGWFQWKAHKYAFQLIMGFHDGKHATMNYVDYKQHATKYIGFLLILARSHSRWSTPETSVLIPCVLCTTDTSIIPMLWQPQHYCSRFTPAAALGNLPALPNPSMGGGDGMRSVWVWLHHASCVTSTPAVYCRRPYLSSLCASTSKSKGLAAVACGSRPVLQ